MMGTLLLPLLLLLGASSIAMVGTLMIGTALVAASSGPATEIDGTLVRADDVLSSATTIEGMPTGCEIFWVSLLGELEGKRSGLLSVDSSGAFQFASKLTIGRPGLSLTAVGSGSFALRSLSFMLVAWRMSWLRTSTPFFLSVWSSTGGVLDAVLTVYWGLRERVGGLR
jgi:hypothetical protein